MTFFNASTDENNHSNLSVLPQWWYFPTATVPLTILVFICWITWQRHRNKAHGLKYFDPMANIPNEQIFEHSTPYKHTRPRSLTGQTFNDAHSITSYSPGGQDQIVGVTRRATGGGQDQSAAAARWASNWK